MSTLTKNGYDYYKSKEYWTPAEAAGFVMGIDLGTTMFYSEKDYDTISLVLNASVEGFKNKKLKAYKEIEEVAFETGDLHEEYCPDFCRYDDVYRRYYLTCFEPLEYMRWIVTEKIVKIPFKIGVTFEDGLRWITPPNYDKEKPKTNERYNPKLDWDKSLYYKAEPFSRSTTPHVKEYSSPALTPV